MTRIWTKTAAAIGITAAMLTGGMAANAATPPPSPYSYVTVVWQLRTLPANDHTPTWPQDVYGLAETVGKSLTAVDLPTTCGIAVQVDTYKLSNLPSGGPGSLPAVLTAGVDTHWFGPGPGGWNIDYRLQINDACETTSTSPTTTTASSTTATETTTASTAPTASASTTATTTTTTTGAPTAAAPTTTQSTITAPAIVTTQPRASTTPVASVPVPPVSAPQHSTSAAAIAVVVTPAAPTSTWQMLPGQTGDDLAYTGMSSGTTVGLSIAALTLLTLGGWLVLVSRKRAHR